MEKSYHNQSKQTGQIWKKLSSGVISPIGKFTDTSSHSKTSFIEMREHAEKLEKFYEDAGIRLA